MSSITHLYFNYSNYNFSYRTWNSSSIYYLQIDTPTDAAYYNYDIKFFYHITGGSDSNGHWANLNGGSIRQNAGQSNYYFATLPFGSLQAGQWYVVTCELWYCPAGGDWAASSVTDAGRWFQVRKPIFLWEWDSNNSNYYSSWIGYNDSGLTSDLTSSYNALRYKQATINFKRTIWNQLVNWVIYTYNVVMNAERSADDFYRNSGISGTVYMSTTGSSQIFEARHWNLMRRVVNPTSDALGGGSILSTQVSRGDPFTAQIFLDLTTNLNNLIRSYAS